jgi:hypothetical protein
MKVNIGKYVGWVGPYQIAEALCFWARDTKDEYGFKSKPSWVHEFGTWLAEDRNGDDTWLGKICKWVHDKRRRTVKVKIHNYDVWDADRTLALIILPMLVKLKEEKHGSPNVADEDVPDHLKSTSAAPKKYEWDTDENWHKRWDWVLDEMIWAFTQHNDENAGDQFFDYTETDRCKDYESMISSIKVDREGLQKFEDRKQNGFRLFGTYYTCLWS